MTPSKSQPPTVPSETKGKGCARMCVRVFGGGESCCSPKSVLLKYSFHHHQFLGKLRSGSQGQPTQPFLGRGCPYPPFVDVVLIKQPYARQISVRPGLGRGLAVTCAICFSNGLFHLLVYTVKQNQSKIVSFPRTCDCPVPVEGLQLCDPLLTVGPSI